MPVHRQKTRKWFLKRDSTRNGEFQSNKFFPRGVGGRGVDCRFDFSRWIETEYKTLRDARTTRNPRVKKKNIYIYTYTHTHTEAAIGSGQRNIFVITVIRDRVVGHGTRWKVAGRQIEKKEEKKKEKGKKRGKNVGQKVIVISGWSPVVSMPRHRRRSLFESLLAIGKRLRLMIS